MAAATVAGQEHDFETATQCRWAFQTLIADSGLWRVEVEEPAMQVLTKLVSLECVPGFDVDVARHHATKRNAAEAHPEKVTGEVGPPPTVSRTGLMRERG